MKSGSGEFICIRTVYRFIRKKEGWIHFVLREGLIRRGGRGPRIHCQDPSIGCRRAPVFPQVQGVVRQIVDHQKCRYRQEQEGNNRFHRAA